MNIARSITSRIQYVSGQNGVSTPSSLERASRSASVDLSATIRSWKMWLVTCQRPSFAHPMRRCPLVKMYSALHIERLSTRCQPRALNSATVIRNTGGRAVSYT